MTKQELFHLQPDPLDRQIEENIKQCWDLHAKPIDGFGDFEGLLARIGAIQNTTQPAVKKRGLIIMISDNKVVKEGVSQVGEQVTREVAQSLGKGISTASVLAKGVGCDVFPIDIGINSSDLIPGIDHQKIAMGAGNIRHSAAMTEEQALKAITCGIAQVKKRKEEGYHLLATGEMGIGNTTTSTALLCALTQKAPKDVTGRGAGLNNAGLLRKRTVIEDSLARYNALKTTGAMSEKEQALFALIQLGGFDIAGLVGVFIGGSVYRIPIVIDGLISSVAALIAEQLVPGCRHYMIASHSGREGGTSLVLQRLNLPSYLNGNMALGEGTGALLLFPLLDAIAYYYYNGAMFADANIKAYKRFEEDHRI